MSWNAPDARWLATVLTRGVGAPPPERSVAVLIDALERRNLVGGAPLFRRAEHVPGIWLLQSGSVESSHGFGDRRQIVGIYRAGDVVGDLYVITGVMAPVGARCLHRGVAWYLSAEAIRSLLSEQPGLAVVWLRNVAARSLHAGHRAVELIGGRLEERLARLLLDEASDGAVDLPQQTVAQMLGVQRTSLNRVLKKLERGGAIRVRYGRVLLDDVDGLARVARPDFGAEW